MYDQSNAAARPEISPTEKAPQNYCASRLFMADFAVMSYL